MANPNHDNKGMFASGSGHAAHEPAAVAGKVNAHHAAIDAKAAHAKALHDKFHGPAAQAAKAKAKADEEAHQAASAKLRAAMPQGHHASGDAARTHDQASKNSNNHEFYKSRGLVK